jgi:K+-sensing histidine kinase KdpD
MVGQARPSGRERANTVSGQGTYAVPAAMAGVLVFDWFQVAPTHPLEFPDRANLEELVVFLAVAVLVGEAAAYAGLRADTYELLEEQAALRRVATLVAQEAPPAEVFTP